MLLRRRAWNLSPLRHFMMAGLWIMLAVNILLWGYHLFPVDTAAKAGSCEASSNAQYSLPPQTEASTPATPTPATTPTTSPTLAESERLPVLTAETRSWTCRQPGPSGIETTAAIVLGAFLVPEMLVIFGYISVGAGKWIVSAAIQDKEEVALTHKKAQEAKSQMESDE